LRKTIQAIQDERDELLTQVTARQIELETHKAKIAELRKAAREGKKKTEAAAKKPAAKGPEPQADLTDEFDEE